MNIEEKQELVKIETLIPEAIIDLRYLTADNFFEFVLYDKPYDILRKGSLEKLKIAADILKEKNYKIVIWDAYRPIEVQQMLWDKLPNDDFVAHPSTGSKHNRGCAVDVTLANMQDEILEMPSKFDDFSEKASAKLDGLKEPVYTHLKDLQEAMVAAGFEVYENEWWHFTDTESEIYALV